MFVGVSEMSVNVCMCMCVCRLLGDCKHAIDSLNPTLISAGGDTDEK